MASRTRRSSTFGAPQWTYVLVAIVATGTLLWAVTSHFIPKPGVSGADNTETGVSVTGECNLGVGTMNGGTISHDACAR